MSLQFTVEGSAERECLELMFVKAVDECFPMAESSMPVDLCERKFFLQTQYADVAEYSLWCRQSEVHMAHVQGKGPLFPLQLDWQCMVIVVADALFIVMLVFCVAGRR